VTKAKQIETCAHVKKGTKAVVWFLPTGTVVLCGPCSKTVVQTARAVIRGKGKP
jgi:hypothetical protein